MARLKVREALLPRLVRPEEGHRPPVPLQREASSGFAAATSAPAKPPSEARALGRLYPCELSPDTDAALADVARELVKLWGDRTLTVLELEDRISSAAEKAPSEDAGIMQLRQVLAQIRADYDAVISTEQASVRETGGLHVIGTERHESRRVDNQLRAALAAKATQAAPASSSRWKTTCCASLVVTALPA